MSSKDTPLQRSEAALKKERLAEALRENLKRRKLQKRGRSAASVAPAARDEHAAKDDQRD